eukprot:9467032-Pyramimonas_sp.AAC.1
MGMHLSSVAPTARIVDVLISLANVLDDLLLRKELPSFLASLQLRWSKGNDHDLKELADYICFFRFQLWWQTEFGHPDTGY